MLVLISANRNFSPTEIIALPTWILIMVLLFNTQHALSSHPLTPYILLPLLRLAIPLVYWMSVLSMSVGCVCKAKHLKLCYQLGKKCCTGQQTGQSYFKKNIDWHMQRPKVQQCHWKHTIMVFQGQLFLFCNQHFFYCTPGIHLFSN